MKVVDQWITDRYSLWNADTVDIAKSLPDRSVDLCVTSLPFSSLLTYSASERDMGNVRNDEQFWLHYDYLLEQKRRVMRPGRILAVHCMALPSSKERDGVICLRDFPGDVIRAYQRHGFLYHSEICVWKCPVTAVTRTKALGLLYKQLKKDSAMSRQGIADKIIVMRSPGANDAPVTHTDQSFPVERWQRYASPVWATSEGLDDEGFDRFSAREVDGDESSGIDQTDTLNVRGSKDDNDGKHIAPLQLGVIRRCVKLWSNQGDIVWDPFTGIGSTGYVALQEDRRFVGAELKPLYAHIAAKNLAAAVAESKQPSLFDLAQEAV